MGQSEGIEAKTIQKCYDLNGMRWAIVWQIVGESFVQIIFSNCYGKYIYHYIYKLNHNLSLLSIHRIHYSLNNMPTVEKDMHHSKYAISHAVDLLGTSAIFQRSG